MEQENLKEILDQIKPVDKFNKYIFVSYSSEDSSVVYKDVLELQKRGWNIWIDEKNLDWTKGSWKDDVFPAIQKNDCCFLLFYASRNSLKSKNCYAEVSSTWSDEIIHHHNGPIPVACVDVEEIGDIQNFCSGIYDELDKKKMPSGLSEIEKEKRLLA